jgi:hypothetical protein
MAVSDQFNNGFDAEGKPLPPRRPRWLKVFVAEIERQRRKCRRLHHRESAPDRAARRTATATVCIAVFSVVSAGVTFFTYWVLSGQLEEMRSSGKQTGQIIERMKEANETTKKVAVAAQTQATAMGGQLDAMKTALAQTDRLIAAATVQAGAARIAAITAQQQIRAYVFVKPFAEVYGLDSRQFLQTWIMLRNAGATPASEVLVTASVDALLDAPSDNRFDKGERIAKIDSVLDPSGETLQAAGLVTVHRPFEQSEIDAIATGKDEKVYVWGRITYRDVLREMRHTYFCFSYYGASEHRNEGPNSGLRADKFDYCHHPDDD